MDSSFKEAQNSIRMDNSEPPWPRARRGRVVSASEGMIGQIGITAAPLSQGGKVFVRGEYWDVISATAVPDGVHVKMTGMEQLTLFVQPIS